MLHRAMGGAHEAKQTVLINWFVQKKAGAGLEAVGNGAGVGIVADQHNGSHAVETGVAHAAGEFGTVGRIHVVVEEGNAEFVSAESARGVTAIGETKRFNAHGGQNFFNEVTGGALVIDDESAPLRVG